MLAIYGFHSENIFWKKITYIKTAILDHFVSFINYVLLRSGHTFQSLCCPRSRLLPYSIRYLNVVICKRIKNSSKRYTVRGRMAKVSETGSSSVMIGVWWCPCNTCFPWVKVGVPMWKSNTSLVLRCSDAQCTKIAIFCSKRIEVQVPLLPGKKWSHVMINLKLQKIFQIYHLTKML